MLDFEFHPRARIEFLDAARYYDEVLAGHVDRFVGEIERGVERIRLQPEMFTALSDRTRRGLTRTVPYGILFGVREGKLEFWP